MRVFGQFIDKSSLNRLEFLFELLKELSMSELFNWKTAYSKRRTTNQYNRYITSVSSIKVQTNLKGSWNELHARCIEPLVRLKPLFTIFLLLN